MTHATLDCSKKGQIKLKGTVTFDNVMSLDSKGLESIKTTQASLITLDLSELTHSDSSVLALLINWLRYANTYKKQLNYVSIPPFLEHVMSIYGIDEVLLRSH